MTPNAVARSELIWATRGRTWGFRFLLNAGFDDPLEEYERAFASIGDEISAWERTGPVVAVRFLDPKQRRDSAGRLIPHEFVVFGDSANLINSVDDAKRRLWPLVEFAYEQTWDSGTAPSTTDLRFA